MVRHGRPEVAIPIPVHVTEILFSPEKSPYHSAFQWGFGVYFPL